jgi:hypothetical protein
LGDYQGSEIVTALDRWCWTGQRVNSVDLGIQSFPVFLKLFCCVVSIKRSRNGLSGDGREGAANQPERG